MTKFTDSLRRSRNPEDAVAAADTIDTLVAALTELLDNEGDLTMPMADIDYEISQGSEHHAMVKRARLALEGA